jgi:heme/copper-type cytochrome/quinol oxidase subunit 2
MAEPASTRRPPDVNGNGSGGLPPQSDQEHFDEVVDRDSRIVLGILAGMAVLAALIMSTVALVQSSNKAVTTITRTVAAASAPASTSQTPATPAQVISFKVNGSWKRGPDGKLHDAFTQTEFHVKVGQLIELKVDNEDESAHSITSPEAGVSLMLVPGVHTYTMVVKHAGRFFWSCIVPCDTEAHGWAMKHPGYMAGYITAS